MSSKQSVWLYPEHIVLLAVYISTERTLCCIMMYARVAYIIIKALPLYLHITW